MWKKDNRKWGTNRGWEDRHDGRRLERAKQQVSIVDLYSRETGYDLPAANGSRVQVRCPIPGHEDKNPSCSLYPQDNSFYCFGCGIGGTQVDLLIHTKGMDERSAIELLKSELV